jgi:hypothetical protein
VKVQHAIVRAAFQRIGRAVGSCRKSLKLQLAVLTGKELQRFRHFHVYADHVGRELNGLRHARRQRGRLGGRLDRNLEIGDDPRLAGMDHVVATRLATEHRAVDEAHLTGAANSGAAIVGRSTPFINARRATGRRSLARNGSSLTVTLHIFFIIPPRDEWVGRALYV